MKPSTLIFDYVCAVCWGQLIEDIDQHSAVCAKYGMEHAGYHRRSGIEWQRANSDMALREVERLYQEVEPFNYMLGLAKPKIKRTPEQMKAELKRNNRILHGDGTGL